MKAVLTIIVLINGDWFGMKIPYPTFERCAHLAEKMLYSFGERSDVEVVTIDCRRRIK